MWCITEITPEYRRRMYRILDLYAKPLDHERPVVCFDEKSKQLLEDSRCTIPMKPGSPAKYDYEYKRKGTCNIFVAVEPKAGKHFLQVTDHRTKTDFAHFIKNLVCVQYADAKYVKIVLDNLNTHFPKSILETFPEAEARKLLRRIRFVYTPKHASWLNMAEIEINLLEQECLKRNIGSKEILIDETGAWSNKNNMIKRKINWSFTRHKADKKLANYYVT